MKEIQQIVALTTDTYTYTCGVRAIMMHVGTLECSVKGSSVCGYVCVCKLDPARHPQWIRSKEKEVEVCACAHVSM